MISGADAVARLRAAAPPDPEVYDMLRRILERYGRIRANPRRHQRRRATPR